MKGIIVLLLATLDTVGAFAPISCRPTFGFGAKSCYTGRATVTTKMALDSHFFSSIMLSADEATQAVSAAVDSLDVSGATEVLAKSDGGWFGFLTVPIELLLQGIHSMLETVGVQENSWGVSILGLTLLIKLITYPLTKSQLESTNKMQAVAPLVKDIQTTYASNPEVMNQKIAALYQEEQVNPLAGCLPSIVQLPVFIGLYRAILELAKDNKLNQAFLWLPNLEGPVYGADPTSGSDWILKGWVDGVPALGWEDTLAFLSLPILLVISQYISQALITPPKAPGADDSQASANAILKFLPLMIGWFSLNVPAALGIYWVANNVITTAITLQVRSSFDASTAVAMANKASAEESMTSNTFRPAPMREKPAGFAAPVIDKDAVKPITAVLDAEIIDPEVVEEGVVSGSDSEGKKVRGKKKKGGKK